MLPMTVSRGRRPHRAGQLVLSSFIWSVADLLRGDYKQSDYGKVILPFTVLRRRQHHATRTRLISSFRTARVTLTY